MNSSVTYETSSDCGNLEVLSAAFQTHYSTLALVHCVLQHHLQSEFVPHRAASVVVLGPSMSL